MDFVILKVNGQDVSTSSHEHAVRCFQSAQEPIIVEVLRRQNPAMSASMTPVMQDQEYQAQYQEQEQEQHQDQENTFTLLVSTAVQTDWAGLIDDDDFVPMTLHADEQTNDSFDDILTQEIDFEEVTLCKSESAEKLGLTVCYSSGSGSEEADTEVYISEIVPESLAARDGRLREGDQILRVNGKDVANKEQTENLFAETKSAVTILVSRCLYGDDDYDNKRIYHEGSPRLSPEVTTPAYQNSMIEQLIRQQKQGSKEPSTTNIKSKDDEVPAVPCHALDYSSITQKTSVELEHQHRQKWMQDALKECVQKVDEMNVGQKQQVSLVEAYASHVWSDTEHIYETIPESDNEPIYSSPYEHRNWLQQPNNNHLHSNNQTGVNQVSNNVKPWHSSSKSNSSGEEKDSSSAYNTGESCNSNTLTLELQQPSDHHRSTLVLCPPKPTLTTPVSSTPKIQCNCSVPLTSSIKFCKISSPQNPNSRRGSQLSQQQLQQPHSSVLAADTMYTNVANLHQTMRLQQQLFKQAMSKRKSGVGRSRGQISFQAPSLAQYQFVASHQMNNQSITEQQPQAQEYSDQVQMEWKVKRRPDGTRYIARRPVRNRILRNRALRINEERQGHTTEEDTLSEIKVGRYWNKEDRKKQLERARERKQRQQEFTQQMQQSNEQLICDYIEENKLPKKSLNTMDQGYKKTLRKKSQVDDFATVQEMLVHGNRVGSNTPNTTGAKNHNVCINSNM
ncbi:PREDICTED: E3 ubiquitin-protein ligase PDZRN3 [Ceratosolen solmsi marchali]|uniref:E3 ubiquitin-protein ligase PDZRN3 n=1 Tax=Ceratosolen solmsi marchali TaxID=326594 RepID=A0AAJ6YD15_9HYME|nr:PREDICTED: E3 ubiquitin-protein ligase PDZRN3 [Ceratosolen solmsi marchali]